MSVNAPADRQISDVSCSKPKNNEKSKRGVAGLLTSSILEHFGKLLRQVSDVKFYVC
jgi:phenylpyruvate tautomerase PptA (4-oxalocrotonate tautomerase family)